MISRSPGHRTDERVLPSRIRAYVRSVAIGAVAGGVGGEKYGRLTAIAWPPVRPAPLSSGQDKYFADAQHAVGLAGRFELDFQLPLNHEDQIDPVGGEPVRVDGLGPLAHPDHFDALPGEHRPDTAERRRPDLTGLAEHDVENFRDRAARILDGHEIPSVGGDAPGPSARRAARPDPLPGNICVAGGPARSGPGIAPGTGDLGPGRTGPTPAEPPGGSATVKVAQGEGNPEGNRRGTKPDSNGRRGRTENAGRRETRGRRTKGRAWVGKRETGGKPGRETGGREMRPQTTR